MLKQSTRRNNLTKEADIYRLETVEVTKYNEQGILALQSMLQADLSVCENQKRKLDNWETEIKDKLEQIRLILNQSQK